MNESEDSPYRDDPGMEYIKETQKKKKKKNNFMFSPTCVESQ